MENKQAIANMKQGKNIPYKHETIATLVSMVDKLEQIEQVIEEWNDNWQECQRDLWMYLADIKEVLENE